MDDDTRFSAARSDPRFKKQRSKKTKVKIDARFKAALTDDNFGLAQAPVDKYGRRAKSHDRKSELAQFYEVDDDEGRFEQLQKMARGEASGSASASSSDEEDDDEVSNEEEENKLDMIAWDADLPVTHAVVSKISSARLALTDCDWTHLSAKDIWAIVQSLCPRGGRCLGVDVYTSEYGVKALAEEARFGPRGLFTDENQVATVLPVVEEVVDTGFNENTLRKYELSKLRWYYAILTLDSAETAEAIYRNDGIELESTSMPLSLAMVDAGQAFDKKRLRDSTTFQENNDLKDYQPPAQFAVKARQHTKIECTWDDDDPGREKTISAAFTKTDDHDLNLKAYLADSESDSEDDNRRQRLRAQLGLSVNDSESDQDSNQDAPLIDFSSSSNTLLETLEEDTTKASRPKKNLKKTQKPAHDAFFLTEPDDDDKNNDEEDSRDYDATKLLKAQRLSKKKKLKGKRKRQLDALLAETTKSDFKFNPKDSRFATAIEQDHRFAVDPANPDFKETAAMATLLDHQSKSRRARREA